MIGQTDSLTILGIAVLFISRMQKSSPQPTISANDFTLHFCLLRRFNLSHTQILQYPSPLYSFPSINLTSTLLLLPHRLLNKSYNPFRLRFDLKNTNTTVQLGIFERKNELSVV